EKACRVRERGAFGEGHFDDILVRLTGADDPVVRPHRNPGHRVRRLSPFHLLDHIGVGLLDEHSDASERLGPPIIQRLDSRIDEMRGRASSLSSLRAALGLFHGGVAFFMVVVARRHLSIASSGCLCYPNDTSSSPGRTAASAGRMLSKCSTYRSCPSPAIQSRSPPSCPPP